MSVAAERVVCRSHDHLARVFTVLHHTQLALVSFSQLSAAVVRHKASDGIVYAI